MVKMVGSRCAPNLAILSDFDCLQPRRRFLRYLFETHMGIRDYQNELTCQVSKVYLIHNPLKNYFSDLLQNTNADLSG